MALCFNQWTVSIYYIRHTYSAVLLPVEYKSKLFIPCNHFKGSVFILFVEYHRFKMAIFPRSRLFNGIVKLLFLFIVCTNWVIKKKKTNSVTFHRQ